MFSSVYGLGRRPSSTLVLLDHYANTEAGANEHIATSNAEATGLVVSFIYRDQRIIIQVWTREASAGIRRIPYYNGAKKGTQDTWIGENGITPTNI
jgi:hypothetical protein